jgi:cyclophilin family peptidyl-prolyl cis-trans isomerase/HEAT repeat protein
MIVLTALPLPAAAQSINAARFAILQAEDRRAATAADLATIRAGVRSGDPQTARVAVRALGRLERPALIPDILPALTSRYSEVRTDAAHAVAQAAAGSRRGATGGPGAAAILARLAEAIEDEDDSEVRSAMAESIGRLTYADAATVAAAQEALVDLARSETAVLDRLGVAKGFEALVRSSKGMTLTGPATDLLMQLAGLEAPPAAESNDAPPRAPLPTAKPDSLRDTRVRRLAVEALSTAGALDEARIELAQGDVDPQVRRLATRAAARAHLLPALMRGLQDRSSIVRLEGIRGLPDAAGRDACPLALGSTVDDDIHVVLQAVDQLSLCAEVETAVTFLAESAADRTALGDPRGWHRPAHALVSLAAASPETATPLVASFVGSPNPFVRVYAARAAERLKDGAMLDRLAADTDDNVVEAAVDGLVKVSGRAATARFTAALQRRGYQAIRAAARALEVAEPSPETIGALNAALDRLIEEGPDNSTDARTAIIATLEKLGAPVKPRSAKPATASALSLDDLRRLASPRARITMRGLGVIDVALLTWEAPATVLQFARLAERGYYNGLTIHRVVPNFVLQGGSPAANEYVGHPDYIRDEVGLWPHVRGALGISTRGRDTGDAQFFIDLVDNPRLDHEYTVFGQIITGAEVADRVLEGDVIESIQILAGR